MHEIVDFRGTKNNNCTITFHASSSMLVHQSCGHDVNISFEQTLLAKSRGMEARAGSKQLNAGTPRNGRSRDWFEIAEKARGIGEHGRPRKKKKKERKKRESSYRISVKRPCSID